MQIRNVRFIIAAITTFSAYAVYVSRVNLSIAIIAMVDDNHNSQHGSAATKEQEPPRKPPLALSSKSADNISELNRPGETSLFGKPPDADGGRLDQRQRRSTLDAAHLSERPIGYDQDDDELSRARQRSSNKTNFDQVHPPPMSTKNSLRLPMISQHKFDWDQTEQGHILGAFFYGYILFQVPGARMAESVGAKWIILAANAGSAFISLIFPLSTQLNSVQLLMALRFVMGLCQSAFFPAAYVLFCRWLPEKERSILLPIMFIGSNVGSISTYIMSSYLISATQGWPSVFYLSGMICSVVTLLWCVFGSNGPDDNWLITVSENNYIVSNINKQQLSHRQRSQQQQQIQPQRKQSVIFVDMKSKQVQVVAAGEDGQQATTGSRVGKSRSSCDLNKISSNSNSNSSSNNNNNNNVDDNSHLRLIENSSKSGESSQNSNCKDNNNNNENNEKQPEQAIAELVREPPSWRKLLTSVPIWTLILSMYGNEWSQVVLCYELPTYLNTALNFPIEQNGVINSFFQLSYTVSSPIMSSLGAYMLDNRVMGMKKLQVRKLFQSLATFGQLGCFLSVPICGANRGLIIMFMFSAIVFKSCANAGDIMVSSDLSPEYAGTIFAFANSCGNTAGFFVPLLAGAFVTDAYQREQWTPFWLTSAAIMAASGLVFLIFGDTSRQDFVADKTEKKRKKKKKPQTNANSEIDINNNNVCDTNQGEKFGLVQICLSNKQINK